MPSKKDYWKNPEKYREDAKKYHPIIKWKPIKCSICDKEFTPNKGANKNTKYCSQKCRRRGQHIGRLEYNHERNRQWYKDHKEYRAKYSKERRSQNIELYNWYHNKDRFGGMRDIVIKRDNNQCKLCGSIKKIIVHHIDGSGYTQKELESNNDLKNLITLCKQCHSALHHWQRKNRKLNSSEDIVRTLGKPKERHQYGVDRKSFIYGI